MAQNTAGKTWLCTLCTLVSCRVLINANLLILDATNATVWRHSVVVGSELLSQMVIALQLCIVVSRALSVGPCMLADCFSTKAFTGHALTTAPYYTDPLLRSKYIAPIAKMNHCTRTQHL